MTGGSQLKKTIDFQALYSALDTRRTAKGLSWRQVADETDVSASLFTRMAKGKGCDSESYVTLTSWLEAKPQDFVEGDVGEPTSRPETLDLIAAHLRADKNLNQESAEAIRTVLTAAYEQLSERRAAKN